MRFEYICKQTITEETLNTFKKRVVDGIVYGEISPPAALVTKEGIDAYCNVNMDRSALQILDVELTEDGNIIVEFRKCGKLAYEAPFEPKLAMRALVLNNVIKNIITFDYTTPDYPQAT